MRYDYYTLEGDMDLIRERWPKATPDVREGILLILGCDMRDRPRRTQLKDPTPDALIILRRHQGKISIRGIARELEIDKNRLLRNETFMRAYREYDLYGRMRKPPDLRKKKRRKVPRTTTP